MQKCNVILCGKTCHHKNAHRVSKLICTFSVILIKISVVFLFENFRVHEIKQFLKKKTSDTLLDIKTYCKGTLIKTAWYGYRRLEHSRGLGGKDPF